MPSETDKILEAYRRTAPVVDQQLDELAAAGLTPGSGPYDIAAQAAMKFISGKGGGISQLAGKAFSLGGRFADRAKAVHAQKETANWLATKFQGLLSRHNKQLTGKQIKDFIGMQTVSTGSGKIDIGKIPSLSSINDQAVYDEGQLFELLKVVAPEIIDAYETGTTAGQTAVPIETALVEATAAVIANILSYLAGRGIWPKT
jgi:hypothetical protein